jgi:hypothetical protein
MAKKLNPVDGLKSVDDIVSAAIPASNEPAAKPQNREMVTTAIHIPKDLHDLLRRVAFNRAMEQGGRASVSALLVGMIEGQRKKLEAEAAG